MYGVFGVREVEQERGVVDYAPLLLSPGRDDLCLADVIPNLCRTHHLFPSGARPLVWSVLACGSAGWLAGCRRSTD